MMGKIKPSAKEQKDDAERMLMEHHHYYCMKNPDGFARLKIEVLEREAKEEMEKEFNNINN